MEVKYFYVEDDTAILFAANGTPLTAVLLALSDIIPIANFSIPTYPMWLYFAGLIFAFLSKSMIQLINADTRQREKLQAARDFVIEAANSPHASPESQTQINALWELTAQQHMKLLKPHHGPRIDKLRAFFFFGSAVCFLVSTSSLIYLAGFIAEKH